MALTVKLQGTFEIRPSVDSASPGDGGSQYGVQLQGVHQSATIENSQSQAFIDSPASFVTLPISSIMQGETLFFSMNEGAGVGAIRITFSTTGAVEMPVRGTCLLEADSSDHITAVAFQGSATFDWALTGKRS